MTKVIHTIHISIFANFEIRNNDLSEQNTQRKTMSMCI